MKSPAERLVAAEHLAVIARHVLDEAPREACGLIVTRDGEWAILQAHNVLPSPDATRAYVVDPDTLATAAGLVQRGFQIAAIYHSHTNGCESLSEADRRQAAPDGQPLYPGTVYLLVLPLPAGQPVRLGPWDLVAGGCRFRIYIWWRGEYRLTRLRGQHPNVDLTEAKPLA